MKNITLILSLLVAVGCKTAPKNDATDANTPSVHQSMVVTEDGKSKKKPSSKAQKTSTQAPSAAGQVNCTKGSDTRILAIQNKNPGCEAIYTKASQPKVVASSAVSDAQCKKVVANIRKNLEASGYQCQ